MTVSFLDCTTTLYVVLYCASLTDASELAVLAEATLAAAAVRAGRVRADRRPPVALVILVGALIDICRDTLSSGHQSPLHTYI